VPQPAATAFCGLQANSQGYFERESRGPDLAPADVTLTRLQRLPDVALAQQQGLRRSAPDRCDTGLWMVAPFADDGTNVYALVHNEIHDHF
jgi:hypothetical protein